MAESPKNTDPAMFNQVHRHTRAFGSHSPSLSVVATPANALATRKQIDPKASGRHPVPTRAFSFTAVMSAADVLESVEYLGALESPMPTEGLVTSFTH